MRCKSCKDTVEELWFGKCEDCWVEEERDYLRV